MSDSGKKDDLVTPPAQAEPQRRVYQLPAELVERIVEFQKEKGLPSEVEAVRRLLDDALKSRDDLDRIVNRFLGKLKYARIASEVAKDVLVGHPLVASLSFEPDMVAVTLKDGWRARISDAGSVYIYDSTGEPHKWKRLTKEPYGPGEMELPF